MKYVPAYPGTCLAANPGGCACQHSEINMLGYCSGFAMIARNAEAAGHMMQRAPQIILGRQ
jgi:hypothetical protein